MPSFTTQVSNLQSLGLVLEIGVAPGKVAEELQGARPSGSAGLLSVSAMIDTGAACSVVAAGLPKKLGLSPVGVARISTPAAHAVECYEYLVRFVFPNEVICETTVIEASLRGHHIQCLIGRDVLAEAVLVYVGHNDSFTLSF